MRSMTHRCRALPALIFTAGLFGCVTAPPVATETRNPIVGAWLVNDPNAPFPYHMYVFNADGTMQQANPDAGDPRTSDSDGKGAWIADGAQVKGKWAEVLADRVSHQFAGRTEISFRFTVAGDRFTGSETVSSFDEHGVLKETWEARANVEGKRVGPL
jgi:hypothetical protein